MKGGGLVLTFTIQQYELHASFFTIEAQDKAEAILKVLSGEAEMDNGGSDYIEPAEDFYQPHLGLTDEEVRKLEKAGHPLNEDGGLPSIRAVEKV